MKVAFVGAGSTYTPAIVNRLLQSSWGKSVHKISLIDKEKDRLSAITFLTNIVAEKAERKGLIEAHLELEEGLKGADFLIFQVRAGGLEGRYRDETLPLECGFVGGESIGAGGLSHTLRIIPEVMKIAKTAKNICPGAWFLVLSNPTGIIVRAILENFSLPVIGICDVPFETAKRVSSIVQAVPDNLAVYTAGLNHVNYIISVKENDEEILPGFIDSWEKKHEEILGFPGDLARALQVIPCLPYMRYYYNPEAMIQEQRELAQPRAGKLQQWQQMVFGDYKKQTGKVLEQVLNERKAPFYAEVIALVCGALSGEEESVSVSLTTRNNGAISDLYSDSVVEVPCILSQNSCKPEGGVVFPPAALALIRNMELYDRLAVQAGLNPSRENVLSALLTNPLVGTWPGAVRLTDKWGIN